MSVHSLGKSVKILCTLTPMMSMTSFLCFLIALIAPYWIHVEERFPNKNRTILFGPNASIEYFERYSYGGLWKVCSTSYLHNELSCRNIEYFSKRSYEPDPYDTSLVIPYSMLNSAGFFLTGGTFMFIGVILFLLGHLLRKRKILTFASGIVFILSGLLLFIGQIVFIAVFKAEVGGKLVPLTSLSPPLVSYKYGFSFTLIILSFLLSELTGTSAIFYFIYHYQHKWSTKELPSYARSKSLSDGSKLLYQKGGGSRRLTTTATTTVGANKTNGFIPNRRHSFDNIKELSHSNHQISNGGPNWIFNRRAGEEAPAAESTPTAVPTSVLNFEDDHCPRHRTFVNSRACFCHNNRCPNVLPNSNDNYQNVLAPVNLSNWEWWNSYWSMGGKFYGPSFYHANSLNHGLGEEGVAPRLNRRSTSFFSQGESDEEDQFSPSQVVNFEVNVSNSPLPGKGILKQTKKILSN